MDRSELLKGGGRTLQIQDGKGITVMKHLLMAGSGKGRQASPTPLGRPGKRNEEQGILDPNST